MCSEDKIKALSAEVLDLRVAVEIRERNIGEMTFQLRTANLQNEEARKEVLMVRSLLSRSEQEEGLLSVQIDELKKACHWIVVLTERWTLTAEERITIAKAKKALGEDVTERPRCPKCQRPSLFPFGPEGLCVHCDSTPEVKPIGVTEARPKRSEDLAQPKNLFEKPKSDCTCLFLLNGTHAKECPSPGQKVAIVPIETEKRNEGS